MKNHILYKSTKISGFAENNIGEAATIVQAFMIVSLFSSYKDILALVPVKNLNADYLSELAYKAMYILEELRFNVLTLISDSNRINRNMFAKSDQSENLNSINNPANPEEKLYLLFDSVPLLKSYKK